MNLRKIRKELGGEVEVTRDRRLKLTTFKAAGLGYTAEEKFFKDEKELADYARSKVPALTIGPRQ
jgi:hypothetical protein